MLALLLLGCVNQPPFSPSSDVLSVSEIEEEIA